MAIKTKEPDSNNFFDDPAFQDYLVTLLCYDVKFLNECSYLLEANDFKPLRGIPNGRARWVIADRALEYYQKYHEPVGKLLRADVLDYARTLGMGVRQIGELKNYVDVLKKLKVVGPDAIAEKVTRYKRERIRAQVIQDLVELQAGGQLTDEKWFELSRKATAEPAGQTHITDYFEGLEERMERRKHNSARNRVPVLFIDPLDSMVRSIGPGQLGLVIAPFKRGKSLMLLWIALAYVLQRLNVLFVTLEDARVEVEDRIDAAISKVPLNRLSENPRTLKRRFARFRRMVRAQLKIVDGTQGGISVARLEQIVLDLRDQGFRVDAILVDYDEELVAVKHQKDKRFELADIYRDYRQMAARLNLLAWIASQTQRNTEDMKILSGDRIAEDISKIRKATMAISLGKGDWGEESIYLWVAAHKHDVQHVGCNIMTDRSRMLIYDRDRTRKMAASEGTGEEE